MHQETTVLVTDMKTSKRKLYVGCCLFLLLGHLWILDQNGQIGPKLAFWAKCWPFWPRWKYPYRKLYLWCCLFLLRLLGHLHNGGGYLPAGHYYCILYSIKTRHNFWAPGRFLNDVECQSNSTPWVTCRIEPIDFLPSTYDFQESFRTYWKVVQMGWKF